MAAKILIPKLGMGTAPLTVVEWKGKEGDWIEQGNIVLVVETEKIRHDVEAETSGFLYILVEEGQEAPIGTVAGLIAETKEELEALQKEMPKEVIATAGVKEAPPAEAGQVEVPAPPAAEVKEGRRILISPVARKMAEEHMIDITTIVGTGPGGKIAKRDVEMEIEAKEKVAAAPPIQVTAEEYDGKRVKSVIPLTGWKRTIAERMHHSLAMSAQVSLMGEIDMTEMMKIRETLVNEAETIGTRISYNDLFVLALTKVLKQYPIMNSSLIGKEIKLWENINIGVAVGFEGKLTVPVIRDTDKKSLVEISLTTKELAKKAREGRLALEEVTGGTFTISNMGSMGVGYRFDTDIINPPEAAILGINAITDRAVVRDGQIVIRPILTYVITYDHRITEGTTAAAFGASLIKLIENPTLLLV